MNEQEKMYGLALAALAGLVARGATPAEVRDTLWQYVEFALAGEPQDEQS
jgi:predicted RNase H-like HicB family nuclease